MKRTFIDWDDFIDCHNVEHEKYFDIFNDWKEEREKLIASLKTAIETIEEMQNYPSVNWMMRIKYLIKEDKTWEK